MKQERKSKSEIARSFGRALVVTVGYAWQKFDEDEVTLHKGRDVFYDAFWKSIKQSFEKKCESVENQIGVKVNLKRLRAAHGRLVWPSIRDRIEASDVLIFDLAAAPMNDVKIIDGIEFSKIVTDLNDNVLIEVGVALGLKKRVVLMCPHHLKDKIPSDIKGFLWTLYTTEVNKGKFVRTFDDEPGLRNGFMGMLKDVVRDITKLDF